MMDRIKEIPKLDAILRDLVTYPSGMEFLKYLCGKVGYTSTSAVVRAGVIDKDATLWNESRRAVWVELRSAVPVEARRLIET